MDQVLKEARRIPEEILGKVSIAVRTPLMFYFVCFCFVALGVYLQAVKYDSLHKSSHMNCGRCQESRA